MSDVHPVTAQTGLHIVSPLVWLENILNILAATKSEVFKPEPGWG